MNTLSLERGPKPGVQASAVDPNPTRPRTEALRPPTFPPFAISLLGRKILVVDDDRLNLRILSGILRGENYTLAEANSGEAALALYPEFQPDIVLLDVMMAGIDGFETCRRLKETYGESCAPVVFITAKTESDDVVQGLAAGGADYLPKPFRPKEVTARIRAHLHGRLLAEQQKQLVEQLSKANAAKNKFLGMAAHDLRNPLASIRGLAEFLRDGVVGTLTPEQLDLVTTIHGASQSMLEMVNELLDVATIEAGELKLRIERHNLVSLIEKSVSLSNNEAAKKQTKIVFAAAGRALLLDIDPAKMRQVIDNLISNAVKYSPPRRHDHGRTPRPARPRRILRQGSGSRHSRERARQALQGLQPALHQAHRRRKKHRPRPRHLPENRRRPPRRHHGRKPARPRLRISRHPPHPEMKTSLTILLVDDEAHIRKFVGLILRQLCTARVLEASNGLEALAIYEREKPDFVLLDVNMPNMTGLETLKKLRELDPDCVAVMLTSLANRQTIDEAIELGAVNYIRKDTTKEEIALTLSETITACFEIPETETAP